VTENAPKRERLVDVEGVRRFTVRLVLDVRDVLVAHGYPELSPTELGELSSALFRFLHDPMPAEKGQQPPVQSLSAAQSPRRSGPR
jgi:hypothetical protein